MDLVWSIPGRSLDLLKIREEGVRIATSYEGLSVEVEQEDTDCISLFYVVPQGERGDAEVEISIYDLGRDGLVLSLEPDAADNEGAWEDAAQLAEDLSEALGGRPLDV
jgi:hypothetical protein|tara:strand:- start:605 stop:928 length:324 start_codon:yes stop_codon:yes gene_type:complete